MKNKTLLIGIAVAVIVLVGGVFAFSFLSNKTTSEPSVVVESTPVEDAVQEIFSKDIGLTLTAAADKKRVIMEITNTEDLSSIEYELSYISKGDIPRGAMGNVEVKIKGKPIRQEIILGTCSDVCHYDQEVSDIAVNVRVNKDDGKVYQAKETLLSL